MDGVWCLSTCPELPLKLSPSGRVPKSLQTSPSQRSRRGRRRRRNRRSCHGAGAIPAPRRPRDRRARARGGDGHAPDRALVRRHPRRDLLRAGLAQGAPLRGGRARALRLLCRARHPDRAWRQADRRDAARGAAAPGRARAAGARERGPGPQASRRRRDRRHRAARARHRSAPLARYRNGGLSRGCAPPTPTTSPKGADRVTTSCEVRAITERRWRRLGRARAAASRGRRRSSAARALGPTASRWPRARPPSRASCPSAAAISASGPTERTSCARTSTPSRTRTSPSWAPTSHAGYDGEVLLGPTALMVGARDAYKVGRIRSKDLWQTLSWPGTWRMAAVELAGGPDRAPPRASPFRARAGGAALRARAHAGRLRAGPVRHPRAGARPRRLAGGRLRHVADRPVRTRAQRALPRRDLVARDRPPDRRRSASCRGWGSLRPVEAATQAEIEEQARARRLVLLQVPLPRRDPRGHGLPVADARPRGAGEGPRPDPRRAGDRGRPGLRQVRGGSLDPRHAHPRAGRSRASRPLRRREVRRPGALADRLRARLRDLHAHRRHAFDRPRRPPVDRLQGDRAVRLGRAEGALPPRPLRGQEARRLRADRARRPARTPTTSSRVRSSRPTAPGS